MNNTVTEKLHLASNRLDIRQADARKAKSPKRKAKLYAEIKIIREDIAKLKAVVAIPKLTKIVRVTTDLMNGLKSINFISAENSDAAVNQERNRWGLAGVRNLGFCSQVVSD